ncbi:hypothetical protein B0H11DRAFT_2413943 [Mycena galericulata]|nr:hypothetical protein B0H11DRAFT_2413943 [Mycena galericulata]
MSYGDLCMNRTRQLKGGGPSLVPYPGWKCDHEPYVNINKGRPLVWTRQLMHPAHKHTLALFRMVRDRYTDISVNAVRFGIPSGRHVLVILRFHTSSRRWEPLDLVTFQAQQPPSSMIPSVDFWLQLIVLKGKCCPSLRHLSGEPNPHSHLDSMLMFRITTLPLLLAAAQETNGPARSDFPQVEKKVFSMGSTVSSPPDFSDGLGQTACPACRSLNLAVRALMAWAWAGLGLSSATLHVLTVDNVLIATFQDRISIPFLHHSHQDVPANPVAVIDGDEGRTADLSTPTLLGYAHL